MANLVKKVIQRATWPALSMDDWVQMMSFGGTNYPFVLNQTMTGNLEEVDRTFEGLIHSAYKSNGTVFACMLARQMPFSEARFAFRERRNGRPGDLFGTPALSILERPWKGGTTADLLSRAIQDVDLSGNFFVIKRPSSSGPVLRRLRPDWMTIILGSLDQPQVIPGDIDSEIAGYMYHPGGRMSGRDPVMLLPEQVAHWAPIPDPIASFRGMSWLLPVIREFLSDSAMITHKQKFFENGATPNLVVTLEPGIKKDAFKEWVEMFSSQYSGVLNSYKTLYLGAGAQVTPVGKDFRQMDFAITQAAGETRIAAAAGVPPVIVGLSEGLKASTYSNYSQARRRFADMTMRPLWRGIANALEIIVPASQTSELWYDDRDIPFLIEDVKDLAEVQSQQTSSISKLIDAGYQPDAVIDAITANDLRRLTGKHTGLYSVQLQPPFPNGIPAKGSGANSPDPAKPEPPDPAPAPTPAPAATKSLEDPLDTLMRLADALRQTPPQVEFHNHMSEGMVKIEAPVSVDAPTTIHKGAFRADAPQIKIEAPTTIADGAVRLEAPVTIAEGAVRTGDTHIAPPELVLRDGAIHVEAPTTIAEGAIRVDAPITVEGHELELRDGAIHVTTPVTIAEGAVQIDAPVTVERSELHLDAGSVQVTTPVTVERTEVHIDEGAVRVDAPVTVERTEVHVDEGAVRVDAPITVQPAEMRMEAGAIQVPVTVEAPQVHVDEGAIRLEAPITVERSDVHLDAGSIVVPVTVQPAEVTIERGAVQVDAPVTIEEGAVRMEAPITVERTDVHVAPAEVRFEEGSIKVDSPVTIAEGAVKVDAPVTVERTEVKVDAPVTIERDAVNVHVEAPETPTVDTTQIEDSIAELRVKVDKINEPKRKRFIRDENKLIIGLEDEETE